MYTGFQELFLKHISLSLVNTGNRIAGYIVLNFTGMAKLCRVLLLLYIQPAMNLFLILPTFLMPVFSSNDFSRDKMILLFQLTFISQLGTLSTFFVFIAHCFAYFEVLKSHSFQLGCYLCACVLCSESVCVCIHIYIYICMYMLYEVFLPFCDCSFVV